MLETYRRHLARILMLEYDSPRLWIHPTILRTMCNSRNWLAIGKATELLSTSSTQSLVTTYAAALQTEIVPVLPRFYQPEDNFTSCELSFFLAVEKMLSTLSASLMCSQFVPAFSNLWSVACRERGIDQHDLKMLHNYSFRHPCNPLVSSRETTLQIEIGPIVLRLHHSKTATRSSPRFRVEDTLGDIGTTLSTLQRASRQPTCP
jgi:hypothetical protein